MTTTTTKEWQIVNFASSGPGRSRPGCVGWDEPAGDAMFVIVAANIGTGTGAQLAVPGYCEACAEEGERESTLVDFRSIRDAFDHSQDGQCVRCGYENATPYYPQTETREEAMLGLAQALFPKSFAPDFCPACDDTERPCPRAVKDCPVMRAAAIDAGIPEAVVMGERALTEDERKKTERAAGLLVKCDGCNGRGWYHTAHPIDEAECPVCGGAGEVSP